MRHNNTTEKSILEAAERLFLEKGFALTSTTMIAKEVGCNQSLIHYYFRSKEKPPLARIFIRALVIRARKSYIK